MQKKLAVLTAAAFAVSVLGAVVAPSASAQTMGASKTAATDKNAKKKTAKKVAKKPAKTAKTVKAA
jgi:Mn2+/Fe2+ NRAMP family transporter